MSIEFLKEVKELFVELVKICRKSPLHFMIIFLSSALVGMTYFYVDLSRSTHVLVKSAVELQYQKDTTVINFLERELEKSKADNRELKNDVKESNKYVNEIRDRIEKNNELTKSKNNKK